MAPPTISASPARPPMTPPAMAPLSVPLSFAGSRSGFGVDSFDVVVEVSAMDVRLLVLLLVRVLLVVVSSSVGVA